MATLAGRAPEEPQRYDLTTLQDQQAFAALLRQQERRKRLWARTKLGLVWLALFGLLGVGLRMLDVSYAYIFEHAGFVLAGIWVTLGVSLASITIATLLALLGALGRLSPHALFQGVSSFYVSIFRGTPLLVQIFLIYLGLPQIGQQLKAMGFPELGSLLILGAIPSGILALSLNYGAYMTEIFRAGIQSVAYGQWQAASALGMSRLQTLRMVVMPQAIRTIIPAIGNQFIAMQKDSSLVSVMGVWEITYRANRFARKDSMFMEMFLLAAAVYWIMTIVSEWGQAQLERRMARAERGSGGSGLLGAD